MYHTMQVSQVFILKDVLNKKYLKVTITSGEKLLAMVLPVVQLSIWIYYIVYLYRRKELRAQYNRLPAIFLYRKMSNYNKKAVYSSIIYYSAMTILITLLILYEGLTDINLRFLGYYSTLAYLSIAFKNLSLYNVLKHKKKVLITSLIIITLIGILYIWSKGLHKTIISIVPFSV